MKKIIITIVCLVSLVGVAFALTPEQIRANKQNEAVVDQVMLSMKSNSNWINYLFSSNINLQQQLQALGRLLQASGVNWTPPAVSQSTPPVNWTQYTP